jgi:hypothetical protein
MGIEKPFEKFAAWKLFLAQTAARRASHQNAAFAEIHASKMIFRAVLKINIFNINRISK